MYVLVKLVIFIFLRTSRFYIKVIPMEFLIILLYVYIFQILQHFL